MYKNQDKLFSNMLHKMVNGSNRECKKIHKNHLFVVFIVDFFLLFLSQLNENESKAMNIYKKHK